MNRPIARAVFAGVLLLVPVAPAVAAVTIETLAVRPNPARIARGHAPQVEIEIAVKDRGVTRILGCDLALEFGDGTPDAIQRFMDGGPRKATVTHVYEQAGAYVVIARGRPGASGRPCDGERRVPVTVIGEPPPPEPVAPKEVAPPAATACPAGWSLVPGSQVGPRFKCRADNPLPKLECQSGTKYFAQDGVIGCQ
jgi:hypothetical protein